MSDDPKPSFRPMDCSGLVGPIWFAGWLFTIGFLGLSFSKGLLALVVWPYFLGAAAK